MSYTLDISLALGGSKTGLTLNAQLVDSSLANVGSAISSGFYEVGNGYYLCQLLLHKKRFLNR
jgi:hypothetical protein